MIDKKHDEIMIALFFIAAGVWHNKYVVLGMIILAVCYIVLFFLDSVLDHIKKKYLGG